jgi:hypothetical protein
MLRGDLHGDLSLIARSGRAGIGMPFCFSRDFPPRGAASEKQRQSLTRSR